MTVAAAGMVVMVRVLYARHWGGGIPAGLWVAGWGGGRQNGCRGHSLGLDGGWRIEPAYLRQLLEQFRDGGLSLDEMQARLRDLPYQDLGYARLDHHRPLRTGAAEVVLGRGKTPEQVAGIVNALKGRGQPVLVTKTDRAAYDCVLGATPEAEFHPLAGAIVAPGGPPPTARPGVLLITAGTADLPVAEEAALTARLMGHEPARLNDVGVAGLHRLLGQLPLIQAARVIIVAAGMEAALAGVVAGLTAAPVIAVPTSTGYGASFGGLAPLLSMLNACAPGVAVVNIDNGFGAGYLAAQMNRLGAADGPESDPPAGGNADDE